MNTNDQMSASESVANWVFEATSADWRLWVVLFAAAWINGSNHASAIAFGVLIGAVSARVLSGRD